MAFCLAKIDRVILFADNRNITFTIKLESSRIYFTVNEDDAGVNLDLQSTGFKCFFNFFFNVFADNNISNGDIVILDEPATNLHVAGQVELRRQIKEFGENRGITFILSTHMPFLIDPDYLDEVRIIRKEGFVTFRDNKFTVSEGSNVDVILPIKSALTVNRHILLDPTKTTIFVEGIIDYNYLTTFKVLFDKHAFNFLPIQGVKNPNLLKELLNITSQPIVLVDSDYAGKSIKGKLERTAGLEVIVLNDINDKFTQIEDLFGEKDRSKFCEQKNYKKSSVFKNNGRYISKKISKETKDNFRELFNRLAA